MRSISFVKPNQPALPRSGRIADDIWERHRAEIMRQFTSSGIAGFVQALNWIKSQSIPDFNPNARQLRHRIKEVWKERISQRGNEVVDMRAPDGSYMIVSQAIGREVHCAKSALSGSKKEQVFGPQRELLDGPTPIHEALQVAVHASSPNTSTSVSVGIKRQASKLDSSTEGERKRHQSSSHDGGIYAVPLLHDIQPKKQSAPGTVHEESESENLDGYENTSKSHSKCTHNKIHQLPKNQSETLRDLDVSSLIQSFQCSAERVKSPVLAPRRLQELLERIGIDWHYSVVTQWLAKGMMFRPLTCPIPPKSVYTPAQLVRIAAFAEFLFTSSLLDEAFPLFLQVWMMRRGQRGNIGIKTLIQCARSAVRNDDQVLVRLLLKQEILYLPKTCPLSGVVRSLTNWELSHVLEYGSESETYDGIRRDAMRTCPSPKSVLSAMSDAQSLTHTVQAEESFNSLYHSLSHEIVTKAFESGKQCKGRARGQSEKVEEYSLRDVLLVRIYVQEFGQDTARATTIHLRRCLKRAAIIFQRPACATSQGVWREQLVQLWRDCPRVPELATFFDLLSNWSPWSAGSFARDTLHFEQTTSFVGMSNLDVISTIAFLVANRNNVPIDLETCFHALSRDDAFTPAYLFNDSHGDHSNGDAHTCQVLSERVSALLGLEDEKLLFGFLWCATKLSRKRRPNEWDRETMSAQYREVVTKVFAASCHLEVSGSPQDKFSDSKILQSFMEVTSVNPTLASSYSTTSTLSSMRRHWKLTNTSIISSSWSHRAMTVDELSETASLMTLSKAPDGDDMQENDFLDLAEGTPIASKSK